MSSLTASQSSPVEALNKVMTELKKYWKLVSVFRLLYKFTLANSCIPKMA